LSSSDNRTTSSSGGSGDVTTERCSGVRSGVVNGEFSTLELSRVVNRLNTRLFDCDVHLPQK
jgi:hypothetical protein